MRTEKSRSITRLERIVSLESRVRLYQEWPIVPNARENGEVMSNVLAITSAVLNNL